MQIEVRVHTAARQERWRHSLRVHLPERAALGQALGGRIPIRGFPDGITDSSLDEGAVLIHDEAHALDVYDTCTERHAKDLEAEGVVRRIREEYITHPDYHSFTWLSGGDFSALLGELDLAGYEQVTLNAVSSALTAFEQSGYETRVILWRLY